MKYTKDYGNYTFAVSTLLDGLHWVYSCPSKRLSLSIICHAGSYGRETGRFEVMCSWKNGVVGWLDFGQVQRRIDLFKKKARA